MKKLLGALFALLAIGPAIAQTPTTPAIAAMVCANNTVVPTPVNGQFFYVQCDSNGKLITSGGGGGGSGTVTSVSVTTANGVSGTVANPTTTPAISLTLGAITPTTVNGNTFTTGTGTLTLGSVTLNAGAGGTLGSNAFTSTAYAPIASPTFTGTVTMPDASTFASTGFSVGGNALLTGPSANTLALQNGASAQTLQINGNYSGGGTNYERLSITKVSGGAAVIDVQHSGTGAASTKLAFRLDGVDKLDFGDTAPGIWTVSAGLTAISGIKVPNEVDIGAAFDGVTLGVSRWFGWSSTANPTAAPDTNFSRVSPGLVQLGTTAANAGGSLNLTNITATGAAIIFNGLATDAAATDTTLCSRSSDGTVLKGSGTLGICLGTSSIRYKLRVADIAVGLPEIMALPAKSFYLDAQHGDPTKLMYGFTAEDCAKVLPTLTGLDADARPNTCDYLGVVPVLVRAVQQQQAQIEKLKLAQRN